MTPTRRNELIRIATKGKPLSDFTLNQQIKLLWVLGCWEDAPEVNKHYEIKEQQLNLLR